MHLSILIPTFNHSCLALVSTLHTQCERVAGLDYEIVVAEDGSNDPSTLADNGKIAHFSHCRHIVREENVGRSLIRNFLALEAKGDNLLFVDAQIKVDHDDFVARYCPLEAHLSVVVGGTSVYEADKALLRRNLRMRYEAQFAHAHPLAARQRHPYQNFRSNNFLAPRDVVLRFPFPHRFTTYGYEDTLWGRILQEGGIRIDHIDNPQLYYREEPNEVFLQKTRMAIDNLAACREAMKGYSRLLATERWLKRLGLRRVCALLLGAGIPAFEHNLKGRRPSLTIFMLWKLAVMLRART